MEASECVGAWRKKRAKGKNRQDAHCAHGRAGAKKEKSLSHVRTRLTNPVSCSFDFAGSWRTRRGEARHYSVECSTHESIHWLSTGHTGSREDRVGLRAVRWWLHQLSKASG